MKTLALALVLFVSGLAHAASIQLNWLQSTSPNIAFNSVYRSNVQGGTYTLFFATNAPAISFLDSNVDNDPVHCYVVTATDTNGVESGFSNQSCVRLTVKTPTQLKAVPAP